MEDNNSLTIKNLVEQSYSTALEKGWYDGLEPPFMERLMLICCEVAEAAEEYRIHGMHPDKLLYFGEKGKPEGIASELADVLVRVADLCGRHGIPLEEALNKKMEYNKSRPYRHGNKLA